MRVLSAGMTALLGLALASTASAQFTSQKPSPYGKGTGTIHQRGLPAQSPLAGAAQPGAPGGSMNLLVGGSDSCATPDLISGPGSVLFDNSIATTGVEGQVEVLCYFFASTAMETDVWFAWTATADGMALMSTCTSTVDTKIAVYPGSACPLDGTSVACNDDSCGGTGFQSAVNFPVVNGNTYMVQVGTFPGALGGTGNLDITISPPATNDDCALPEVVVGAGPHAFNSLSATTGVEGQVEALCYFFASTVIDNDVWFTWTSNVTGAVLASSCTQTNVDTKIAVYDGAGCPTGSAIGCNDDACGLQSTAVFNAVTGNTYTIQLGTFPGAAGGLGSFTLAPDPCNALVPDQFEDNDDCPQAVLIGDGVYPGLNVSRTDWDYYEVNVADGDTLTVSLLHTQGVGDIDVFLYDTGLCQTFGAGDVGTTGSLVSGFTSTDDELISWTNTTGAARTYSIKVNIWPPSTQGDCNDYDMIVTGATGGVATAFCSGDGTATACPCGNVGGAGRGCDNFTGSTGALLSATGSSSIGAADLVLVGEGAQANQPGLYFQGDNAILGGQGIVNGDGLRCAGGNIRRLQVRLANGSGASATTINVASVGLVSAGQTKRYQWWYRNPATSPCGTGFNLSNGVEVTWAP